VFWAILVGSGAVVFLLTFVTMRRHTGALSQKGETYAQSSADRLQIKSAQGPIIADSIYTVADDFVVDVFHNGERVPDNQRSLIGESFGATCEKMLITVHEGDWLVFNVVNNRFRWNAVYYFAAAGVKGNQTIAFASELESGRWSFCDDARDVTRFIAEPQFLAANRALAVQRHPGTVEDIANCHCALALFQRRTDSRRWEDTLVSRERYRISRQRCHQPRHVASRLLCEQCLSKSCGLREAYASGAVVGSARSAENATGFDLHGRARNHSVRPQALARLIHMFRVSTRQVESSILA